MKKIPPPLQMPIGGLLPRTYRESYAAALQAAGCSTAPLKPLLATDDSTKLGTDTRSRWPYDKIHAQFPFIAAGIGDEVV